MPELPKTKEGRIVSGEKSTALSVILNILLAGLGTIYTGKTKDGIFTVITAVFISFIAGGEIAFMQFMLLYPESAAMFLFSVLILTIGYILIFAYSIYQSVTACKENNTLWQDYLTNK